MAQFPWQKPIVVSDNKPTYNDDEGMFRQPDLSGKLTMEEAKQLDIQNRRHMDRFIKSLHNLSPRQSNR
jgi:hypothetical protein